VVVDLSDHLLRLPNVDAHLLIKNIDLEKLEVFANFRRTC
jgi:hypothetical protein